MKNKKDEKEILQARVLEIAERNKPRIEKVIEQFQRDDAAIADTLVDSDQFKFYSGDGHIKVQYGEHDARIAKFATKQIASRFGIPTNFIHKLNSNDWGRKLAADIFNEHSKNTEMQRVLVRKIDNTIGGVLSDKYKRLNSMQIFKAFLLAASQTDAKLYDAAVDETKSFIDVIKPKVVEIETPKNGIVNVAFGAQIRNSDFGDGALNIRTYMLNLICLNGMIGTKYLNEIHRGARLPENIQLSEKTYQLETAASASLVKDAITHIFHDDNIETERNRVINASNKVIDFDKKVTDLKRTKHFSDFELKTLTNKLLAEKPSDGIEGENTLWKFVQGVTSVANEYTTTRKNELIEYASELY